jgi:dCTP deaminase
MSSLQDQVRQDAASLYGFISSISDKCERLNRAVTYPESSERFFAYISQLAAATKSYLQSSLDAPDTPPYEYLGLREEIADLRSGWRFMHQFVKPVLDADTLKLPTCLLDGIKARFRQIPRFSGTDFVFYHSAQLNYFSINPAVLKDEVDRIFASVIGPPFPEHLGLIGIPYSQSESLFVNCLIPHEMGHYVFGELLLAKKLRSGIEDRLIKQCGASLDPKTRGDLTEMVVFWAEELFCDLFAIRLVGFCFSLAFVELFDIATVLDEQGTCQKSNDGLTFRQYPPQLFRLKMQASVLKTDGWWKSLQKVDSHYVRTLEGADGLTNDDFIFTTIPVRIPSNTQVNVKALFLEVLPEIIHSLNEVAGNIPNEAERWGNAGDLIKRYLENGTVPSTLLPENDSAPVFPSPIALLNESYKFYIQSLHRLISRIDNANSSLAGDSSKWAKRVEMWTAKAIEDVSVLGKKRPSPAPLVTEEGTTEIAREEWRAVLSKTETRKRLKLRVDNPKSLVITPLLDPEGFDQDSVDLRLGTHFLMPQVPPEPYVDLADHERANQAYLQLHAPLGSYFVLPAHQTVLGATLEFVKMPYDVSGEILTKSSIARTFIMIETAPWIHPSYRGCLTLEIANVSNTAIILYPGTPIGQLVLFHTGVTEAPEKLSGSYLGPIYPEAPNMKAPCEVLGKIGLTKYRRPGHGWIDDAKTRIEVADAMGKLSHSEQSNVKEIVEILRKNGSFPADNDIGDIFS